jgi:hypothetical protein
MNVESAIKKLQKITKEKEAHMKAKRGSGIVEKNKSRKTVDKSNKRRCVEYSTIGYEIVATFNIIFRMRRRKNV